jgi:hypothetical protein
VRAGCDLAPSNKILWPQDFILGTGKTIKLFYNDLSIYEWVNGYIASVQYEPNQTSAQFVMAHLHNLMHEAKYQGWEPVKAAHAVILTSMESVDLARAFQQLYLDPLNTWVYAGGRSSTSMSACHSVIETVP